MSSPLDAVPVPPPLNSPDPHQADMAKWLRLLVRTTACLALALVAYLVTRLFALVYHTVLLFALGGLLAYALDPVVEFVRGTPAAPKEEAEAAAQNTNADLPEREPSMDAPPRRARKRRPRWLGVVAVFTLLFGATGGATYFLGREAAHQGQMLARDRTQIIANIRKEIDRADIRLAERGVPIHLGQLYDDPPPNVRAWAEGLARASLQMVSNFSKSLVEGIIVLLISAYFLLYSEEMREQAENALPVRIAPYARQWRDDVNRILGGFVRGQFILALVTGVLASIICACLGLRLWLLIGAFAALAALIPVLGPYIGAIPAVISALVTPGGSPEARVVAVLVLFFFMNEFGSKILYPRLVGRALGLHEVLVLGALLAGFEAGGIVGVLFAAPLTALLIVTATQLYRLWRELPPLSVAQAAKAGGEHAKKRGVP